MSVVHLPPPATSADAVAARLRRRAALWEACVRNLAELIALASVLAVVVIGAWGAHG